MTDQRIAVIQHGDYVAAMKAIDSGEAEPYFGMRYCLGILEGLLQGVPHLVISLSAPSGVETRGCGRLVGLPRPSFPVNCPGLGLLAMFLWANRIHREVRAFRPTHVLLRTGMPIVASKILGYCVSHDVRTLALFANRFEEPDHAINRFYRDRLVRLLNHPCVFLVGNHKWPAARSTIEAGVSADKVVAYDYPGLRKPADHPAKCLVQSGRHEIVYVGSVTAAKGVGDLIDATALLVRNGASIRLAVLGDGPDLEVMRRRAHQAGVLDCEMPGRVGNDQAFQRMLGCSLVCVPSRHEFAEAMPLTLTEALAARTPVVVSDHPAFVDAFHDGEGVVFFRAGDADSLAQAIQRVLTSDQLYRALSATAEQAFARVECNTIFGDLISRWMPAISTPRVVHQSPV